MRLAPNRPLLLALGLAALLPAAYAETLSCPDLSRAVQVGTCPSEEELRYTFNGFCSDNARMYRQDAEVCTDYARYRALKNVVLWESADGTFHAYLSCDLPAARVQAAQAQRITIGRDGRINRVACTYGEGIVFSHRTHAQCSASAAECKDPASCVAECR